MLTSILEVTREEYSHSAIFELASFRILVSRARKLTLPKRQSPMILQVYEKTKSPPSMVFEKKMILLENLLFIFGAHGSIPLSKKFVEKKLVLI